MTTEISYTWFPKDWTYSDSTFSLNLEERGVYRELIDMAMINDNKTTLEIELWSRRWNSSKEDVSRILGTLEAKNLITVNGNILTIPSCEKRLDYKRKKSKAGKIGMERRYGKKKEVIAPKKEKAKPKDMNERKQDFANLLKPLVQDFGRIMILQFFNYWTEAGPNDKKMRFEKQTSFDPKKRLATWKKNEQEFKSKPRL